MKLSFLICLFLLSGCEPKCIKGHYGSYTASERWEKTYNYNNQGPTEIWTHIPAHTEQIWLCDEYEKK